MSNKAWMCMGIAAALVLAGCAKAPPETREVDILRALVASLAIPKERLVFMSYPSNCAAAGPPQRVPASLLARFVEANGNLASPLRLDASEVEARLMAWEDNLRFLEDPELAPIAPNDVLLLASRVGYSEDARSALACAEVMVRGGRRAYFVLFQWLGERNWQVTGEFGVEDREIDPRRPIHS